MTEQDERVAAYELTPEWADKFGGGVISIGDGRDLNVLEALEQGGGILTVPESDAVAVVHLDGYEPLQRCDPLAPTSSPSDDAASDDAPLAILRAEAEALGIEPGRKGADRLRELIFEARNQSSTDPADDAGAQG